MPVDRDYILGVNEPEIGSSLDRGVRNTLLSDVYGSTSLPSLSRRLSQLRLRTATLNSGVREALQDRVERFVNVADALTNYPYRRGETQGILSWGEFETVVRTRLLSRAWFPMQLHEKQLAAWNGFDEARFITLPCGRRSGKTVISRRKFVLHVVRQPRCEPGTARYACAAPTHAHARDLFWETLKSLIPNWMVKVGSISESRLRIVLAHNNAEIIVSGLDEPSRFEGPPLRGILADEFPNIKPVAWFQHVRPMLSETDGFGWLIGVPEGRNHYFDLCTQTNPEWQNHHWTSEDVLPIYKGEEAAAREIASAKHDMDDRTYRQEYLASFELFNGLAYYSFEHALNVTSTKYDPALDIHVAFDFNIAPGVAVILQEKKDGSHVIDEVYIDEGSNTPRVCNEVIKKFATHMKRVYVYADATGGSGGSAKVAGSDLDLIRKIFRARWGESVYFRVPDGNPPERARVNAVNARLKAMDGTVRLFIDRDKGKYLIRDMEGVLIRSDGSIDKRDSTTKLTHISDALGYFVTRAHPLTQIVTRTMDI